MSSRIDCNDLHFSAPLVERHAFKKRSPMHPSRGKIDFTSVKFRILILETMFREIVDSSILDFSISLFLDSRMFLFPQFNGKFI